MNDNSNYIKPNFQDPNYSTTETENKTPANETSNQELSSKDYNTLMSSILKNEEQSKNLSAQREVINEAYAKNKELEEALARQAQEIEQLKKVQATLNSQGVNDDYIAKLNAMETHINEMKRKEMEQAFVPVLDTFKKFGIKRNEVDGILNDIKKQGVDLTKTPNVELAEFFLSKLQNEPNTTPNGGYSYNTPDVQQLQVNAEFESKKQKILDDLEAYTNSKKYK